MSKKHKQRRCRICKKRPVWIGGDVKNHKARARNATTPMSGPSAKGAAVKKCQRAILRNRTMTPSGAHLCSLLKRGESLTHGPLRELGDTVQVQLVHDLLRWPSIVFTQTCSIPAISFVLLPSAKSCKTARSRAEPQVPRLVRRCAKALSVGLHGDLLNRCR